MRCRENEWIEENNNRFERDEMVRLKERRMPGYTANAQRPLRKQTIFILIHYVCFWNSPSDGQLGRVHAYTLGGSVSPSSVFFKEFSITRLVSILVLIHTHCNRLHKQHPMVCALEIFRRSLGFDCKRGEARGSNYESRPSFPAETVVTSPDYGSE